VTAPPIAGFPQPFSGRLPMYQKSRMSTINDMRNSKPARIRAEDITPNHKRGGELRIVLGPGSVGCRSGYMGTTILQPGDYVVEHYHPYSEEFLYCIRGEQVLDIEGEEWTLSPGEGMYVPIGLRHRLRNVGDTEALNVYHLGPLAPDPSLSHIDTEVHPAGQDTAERGRILFTVHVPEEKREAFLEAYEKVRYAVANTPGHLQDQICQSSMDPEQWLITSEWTSLAEFWAWEKSPEHKTTMQPMRDHYTKVDFKAFSVVAETSARR
jgi:quercetin dioxygenase-like cupin family protein/heme-degrading monooxygenase HmoA